MIGFHILKCREFGLDKEDATLEEATLSHVAIFRWEDVYNSSTAVKVT